MVEVWVQDNGPKGEGACWEETKTPAQKMPTSDSGNFFGAAQLQALVVGFRNLQQSSKSRV